MSYLIQYIRNKVVIGSEEVFEHPSEDYLRAQVERLGADFADVSRTEDQTTL